MATKSIANYLEDLVKQRNNLADNLNTMGVSAEQTELLNTLVPKVLQINGSGSTGSGELKGILAFNGVIEDAIKGEADIVIIGDNPYGYVKNGLEYYLDAETANTVGGTGWQNLVTGRVYLFNGTETKTNNSFVFDKNTYLSLSVIKYANFTIEIVMKDTSTDAKNMNVINNFEDAGYGIGLYDGDCPSMWVYIDNSWYTLTSNTTALNKVTSCSGSYDGTELSLSHNNVKKTLAKSGSIKQSSTPFEIGRDSASDISSLYFRGEIYCVRIYSRALTAEEVQQNYEIDKARYGIEEVAQ